MNAFFEHPRNSIPAFTEIVFKLASRCNINCDYCYWFRDKSVYDKPKLLLPAVKDAFLKKLSRYALESGEKNFSVILHGGEPLLYGKERVKHLCEDFQSLEQTMGIVININITTNALLIDQDWCDLFKHYQMGIAVSLDGDKDAHDAARKDFKGLGTFERVTEKLQLLKNNGIEPAILAVCSPTHDPATLLHEFVVQLGLRYIDVLIPDHIFSDSAPSIAHYYQRLFDLWYEKYAKEGIKIRIFESIISSLLGSGPTVDKLGYAPKTTLVIMPDGSIEADDTLRIAGKGFTQSKINVLEHELVDVMKNPLWQEAYASSLQLAPVCQSCDFKMECGGGPLQSRWSVEKEFNNPSVYCEDIKQILGYIRERVTADLYVSGEEQP